jgi:hypothetical protein
MWVGGERHAPATSSQMIFNSSFLSKSKHLAYQRTQLIANTAVTAGAINWVLIQKCTEWKTLIYLHISDRDEPINIVRGIALIHYADKINNLLMVMYVTELCEIWWSHSGCTEDSRGPRNDAVSTGYKFTTFRRIKLSSSSGSMSLRILLGVPDESPVTVSPTSLPNIPEPIHKHKRHCRFRPDRRNTYKTWCDDKKLLLN